VPTPTSTPADGWVEASNISSDHYTEIAMVVDSAGVVHAAGALGGSIWYLTNSGGSWTRERLSNPPGSDVDQEPTIAGNESALTVAFTRFFDTHGFGFAPEGLYLVNGDASAWADPASFGEAAGNEPSLTARGGHLFLAYRAGIPIDVVEEGDEYPIRFATNRTGSWTDVVVSPNGSEPSLALTGTGRARIVFGDDVGLLPDNALHYAQEAAAPSDAFSVETVPDTDVDDVPYALAHDGGRAHLVYYSRSGDGLYYARRTLAGWDAPVRLADLAPTSLAAVTDSDNKVHVVATTLSDGVWYFTNRHGAWESKQLLAPGSAAWYVHDAAIDVDGSGRAHILLVVGTNRRSTSLWYAVSPAG
jgi:hypothetical protein